MSKSPTIKVLVVDDHKVVREGLQRILESDTDLEVIGEAGSGEEAISKADSLSPDVIIMDVKMPGMDGIDATRAIKQKTPDVNVLVLTLYAEDFIERAFQAGVSGYLLKDSDGEQITQAVHQVHNGLSPLAPSLTREMVTKFTKLSRSYQSSLLTKRQIEVLKMIAAGVNGKDISECLFISTATLKREIRNIFNKLGVNDRAQAVAEAMKRQLI